MSKVSHPAHYNMGKIEVIDFIEDQQLGFNLGNAVKYISRAGKKNPGTLVEDLQKAVWYLEREIKNRSPEKSQLEKALDGISREDAIHLKSDTNPRQRFPIENGTEREIPGGRILPGQLDPGTPDPINFEG